MMTSSLRSLIPVVLASLTLLVLALPAQARMRMYNPELGTFMQRDPGLQPRGGMQGFVPRAGQGYQDGMSLYAGYFALNGGLDPTGLDSLPRHNDGQFAEGINPGALDALRRQLSDDPNNEDLQRLTTSLEGTLGELPTSEREEGWAAPGVNFAGAGWRYTAKARPTSRWDFDAKLHDFNYHVNGLRHPCKETCQDRFCLSRCAKADYIFIIMARAVRDRTSAGNRFYDRFTRSGGFFAFFELGEDRSKFLKCDGFRNVLRVEEYPELGPPDYLMLPWSILTRAGQRTAEHAADQAFPRISSPGPRSHDRPSIRTAGYHKYKYEFLLPEDGSNEWRDWAASEFKGSWTEATNITNMTGEWP